jgi:urocanate hydratase
LGRIECDPRDIAVTDDLIASLFPQNASLLLAETGEGKIAFQGLPARICWLGQGEREKAGLALTSWCVVEGKSAHRHWS